MVVTVYHIKCLPAYGTRSFCCALFAPGPAPSSLPHLMRLSQQCVEDIQLPPLAECHHYINLTNGIEAIPRLQQLGLPYRHANCTLCR